MFWMIDEHYDRIRILFPFKDGHQWLQKTTCAGGHVGDKWEGQNKLHQPEVWGDHERRAKESSAKASEETEQQDKIDTEAWSWAEWPGQGDQSGCSGHGIEIVSLNNNNYNNK